MNYITATASVGAFPSGGMNTEIMVEFMKTKVQILTFRLPKESPQDHHPGDRNL